MGPRVGCFALVAPQGRLTRGVVPATSDDGRLFHCTDAVRGCMERQPRPRAGQVTGKGGFVGTAPDTRRPSRDCGALRARRQCCAPNCHYKVGLSGARAAQKQRRTPCLRGKLPTAQNRWLRRAMILLSPSPQSHWGQNVPQAGIYRLLPAALARPS